MAGPIKPDYGPKGCCQGIAVGVLGALVVLGWGVVFVVIQVVRWVA